MDKAKMRNKRRTTTAFKDLLVIFIITIIIFIISYFFNVFVYLMRLFQENPKAITWIDEIIVGLITLSVSFAVFSWRRWLELKKETALRLKLQEELIRIAETKAETERIISKQLHCEVEERKRT
ncbi:MAG: hypothetical protein PHP10_00630 [Candidatus Omnitrophica bacterium]|nr:hypothetical protein [Candidatus Omnitrophota bacterium]